MIKFGQLFACIQSIFRACWLLILEKCLCFIIYDNLLDLCDCFQLDIGSIKFSCVQVLEFEKGRLQNLFWKRDGCARCSNNSTFVCINNQDCAIRTPNCIYRGGRVDCSFAIQLAFSGTDKHLSVFNSWYEVSKLRQYSLFNLYSNLKDSLTSQYNKMF